jgi:organic radical activating enzyme
LITFVNLAAAFNFQTKEIRVTESRSGIAFLRNIGMMMTYRCQAACPHCVVEAGPHRTEEISLDEALDWTNQIATYRNGHIRALSLTGGEPFYCFDKLKAVARHGAELGLIVTTITNGFWATSIHEATQILREVVGLKMIGISADPYHQTFIPFDRVKNAVIAAQECGLPYRIVITTEDETCKEYKEFRARIDEICSAEHIQLTITFLAGRATHTINPSRQWTSEIPCQSRCEAAGAPVLFPDGRVIACIGALIALPNQHPLVLGNVRQNSLADILDRSEVNTILHGLRVWGPGRLVSLIKDSQGGSDLPDRFIDNAICDPCYKIMSNKRLLQWVEKMANDPEYIRTVAYGRSYHLKEDEMLSFLGWL